MLLEGRCREKHPAFICPKLNISFRKFFCILYKNVKLKQKILYVTSLTILVNRKQYPYTWLFLRCSFLSNSSSRSFPALRCSASRPSRTYMLSSKNDQRQLLASSNLGQFVSEFLELRIIIRLDNVVMILKLVQIQGLLHHFAIFFKTGCTLLKLGVLGVSNC